MSETVQLNETKLGVGEVLICNKETKGKFEPLKYFIGKVINAIGGGGNKIYVVEEKDKYSSEVKSIQSKGLQDLLKSENKFNTAINDDDTYQHHQQQQQPQQHDLFTQSSSKGNNNNNNNDMNDEEHEAQIIQICKGKYHLVKLTNDGKVRCSGEPYFGVTGLGGAAYSETTKLLPNLKDVKVVQISAGKFHSLALAANGDLYTWGMGFEGQLGLSLQHKVASSPRYLKFFYRKPVKFISCGHNYSLAITRDGVLYGWGENKLGQLGLGHVQIVENPTPIPILDKDGGQEGCNSSESLVNQKLEREYTNQPLKPCYVSAGYSHTVVVTDDGKPVTFGLNIYGQLGLGNNVTSFEPRLIEKDECGEYIEPIVKAACSPSGTFLISETGKMYTCGSGDIGHGDIGMVKLPKIIVGQRLYSHVFCNDNSIVAFGPLRILSVSPSCGPATGNTILSIIGSAFKEFPKLSVRFIFGGVSRDVRANFDKLTRTIFVNTPNFLDYCPNMELPCNCTIQVTFDGNFFTEYKEKFFIYPNTIKISAIEPKCGPTTGGTPLHVKINLDQIPQKYLFSLTVGFQAKPPVIDTNTKRYRARKVSSNNQSNVYKSLEESKATTDNVQNTASIDHNNNNNIQQCQLQKESTKPEQLIINPMDIDNLDNQLDKANWYCCFSTFENGMMTCTIPQIENFSQNQVEYNVDVAINGQQFSGYPMIYRFYDIEIDKLTPDISSTEGGLQMKICGSGLFDSVTKRAKITSILGERPTDIQWDRTDKTLILGTCPLNWISNDESLSKPEKPSDLYNKYIFDVSITMNGTQWIKAGSFHYCDPHIKRIAYIQFKDTQSKEDRLSELAQQTELTDDEKITLGLTEPYADKKKNAEYEKKLKEEEDMLNQYKRPYNGLALYGPFFPNVPMMKIRFASQDGDFDVMAFYHNENKVVCLVPEIPKLSPGQHELQIMFSLNGQQWVNTEKKINFMCPEYGTSFEDIIKGDEADKKKKPGKK